jgi:hypothetical protein
MPACGAPAATVVKWSAECGRPIGRADRGYACVQAWGTRVARNTGRGFRRGSLDNRHQVPSRQDSNWTKRHTETGRFVARERGGEVFKGVSQMPDRRRTTN